MKKFIFGYVIGIVFGLYLVDVFLNFSFFVENMHSEVLFYSSIKSSKLDLLVFSLFFMGILFIISVFQSNFYIKKTDERLSLYFSIYCRIVFIIMGATIFPYGDWADVLKFVYIFSAVGFIVFHHYFHAYLNKKPNKSFTYGIWMFSFLSVFLILWADIATSILLFKYITLIQLCYLFYALYHSFMKLKERTLQSKGNLFCITVLFVTSWQGFLTDFDMIEGTSFEAIGMFLFFTLHSTFSSERFLSSYSQTVEMKKLLQDKVSERTKELEQANEEMQQIELEKRQIISNICHDLSNPITSIRLVSKGMIDEIIPSDEKQYFMEMYNQSCLMENLLTDLRQLNLLEGNQLGFQMEEVEWFAFMEKIFNNYRYNLNREQLSYTLIKENDRAQQLNVYIDPVRIEQVYLNLISNCVKFTPENGSITVKVGGDFEKNEAYFILSDNGIGIESNQLTQIFNRFYRTEPIREEKESTGLGLSIVRNIIERHEGSIQIESEPKRGTDAFVRIPLMNKTSSKQLSSG